MMLRQNQQPKKEKDKKEENESTHVVAPDMSMTSHSGGYCTADQCFLKPPATASMPTVQTTPMTSIPNTLLSKSSFETLDKTSHPEAVFNNSTLEYDYAPTDETNTNALLNSIPSDLFEMMQKAAKQGTLYSCLLTLSDEFVTGHLKARNYQPEQIHWINQAVRSLELIALGASLGTALATPVGTYLLSAYAGVKKANAALLTAGTVLAYSILTSPIGLVGTSCTIAASIVASLGGSKVTKSAYNLVRNSFFSTKKTADSSHLAPVIERTLAPRSM